MSETQFKYQGSATLSAKKHAPEAPAKLAAASYFKVHPDSNTFIPKPSADGTYEVTAKLNEMVRLPPRGYYEVDCGFNFLVPAGHRLIAEAMPKFAERSVFVTYVDDGTDRMILGVHNLGREIVTFEDEVAFATIWISPVSQISLNVTTT